MRHRQRRAWVLLAVCSSWVLLGTSGVSAVDASSHPTVYPFAGAVACEQVYGGTFVQSGETRECTVSALAGTKVYTAFESGALGWVQASTFAPDDPSDEVELGPSSIACSKPSPPAPAGWADACI